MFSLDIPSFFIGACVPIIVYLLWYVYYRPIMPTNIYPVRTAGSRKSDTYADKRVVRKDDGKVHFREDDTWDDKLSALLERKYKCDECFHQEK